MNNENGWSWSKFMEELRSHFSIGFHYPRRSEFIALKQERNMTVTTYLQKFTELMYHAPDVVSEEKHKIQRFIEGLLPGIRVYCGSMRRATWSEVIEQAIRVEQALDEEYQSKNKMEELGETSQAKMTRGSSRKQVKKERTTINCWHCGEWGHFHNECELLRRSRVTASGSQSGKLKRRGNK